MTVFALPDANDDARLAPVPWPRMGWVTWRQHRVALTGSAVVLIAIAIYLWITGLQLHHAYGVATACQPAGAAACDEAVINFNSIDNFVTNGFVLQVLPALIGAFVGAPLLAREFETGTFRYAFTQGVGRWRWTLAKITTLAVGLVVATEALSLVLSWYYQPYFAAVNQRVGTTQLVSLDPGLFDLRGITFGAWTLAAFSIGGVAGVVIRRVVPAIVTTLVAYTGLAFATGGWLRAHYLAPIVTRSLNVPASALVLNQRWFTAAGRPASQAVLAHVLNQGGPQMVGKGGVPKSLAIWQYLGRHGFTQWTTYQPAGRFWSFQWIETGWLVGLSLLCIAATLWLVQRRAS